MRVIQCSNYNELSLQAARLVASQMLLKPDCVLGLATGSTPIGMYAELVKLYQKGEIDFSRVTTFNLDEYYPISPESDQSYRYFMNQHLFSKVNIPMEHTHIPDGQTDNPERECANYEAMIDAAGGIDLQVLGIGQNGHIGFNEPDDSLNTATHMTALTRSTIEANARFFNAVSDVPTKALTMGIATILKSRKILLLASGALKRPVVQALLTDDINTNLPATMLKVHPDVVLICDKEAYTGYADGI